MVEWAKFKPEVSGSLLVSPGWMVVDDVDVVTPQVLVVCLMLAIVSISFPYWLTNVSNINNTENTERGLTSPG